jgi:hypothetical protein
VSETKELKQLYEANRGNRPRQFWEEPSQFRAALDPGSTARGCRCGQGSSAHHVLVNLGSPSAFTHTRRRWQEGATTTTGKGKNKVKAKMKLKPPQRGNLTGDHVKKAASLVFLPVRLASSSHAVVAARGGVKVLGGTRGYYPHAHLSDGAPGARTAAASTSAVALRLRVVYLNDSCSSLCTPHRAHLGTRWLDALDLGCLLSHLESRPKASARWVLEVSAGWASASSRGLWGWRRSAALHRRC